MSKTLTCFSVVLLLAACAISTARADNSTQDAATQYSQSYNAYMNDQINAAQQGLNTDTTQANQLQQAAANLQAQQQKDQAKLDKENAKLNQLQAKEQALNSEISQLQALQTANPQGGNAKKIQSDQNKLTKLQTKLTAEQAKVTTAQNTLNATKTNITNANTTLTTQVNVVKNASTTYTTLATKPDSLRTQAAQTQALALLNQGQQNAYDAKLLLTDYGTLKSKYGLDDIAVNQLKQAWGNQLNNTMMGDYVNNQISKAVAATCTAGFQDACSARGAADQANQLGTVLKNALSQTTLSDAMSSTAKTGQNPVPVTVAPVGAPTAAPVAPAAN